MHDHGAADHMLAGQHRLGVVEINDPTVLQALQRPVLNGALVPRIKLSVAA